MKKILLPIMIGAIMLTHPVHAEEQQQRIEEIESQIKDLRAELYELKAEQMGDEVIEFTTKDGFSILVTDWKLNEEENTLEVYFTFSNDSDKITCSCEIGFYAYQNGYEIDDSYSESELFHNRFLDMLPGYSIDAMIPFKLDGRDDVILRVRSSPYDEMRTIKLQ